MKACLHNLEMFCSREKLIGLIGKEQNDESSQVYSKKYGLEALQLLQILEKCVIGDCDYKNHRIFTLGCISEGIVPVSVSLRSACSKISKGAKEIIQKAEQQFLQDRVMYINAIIEDNGNNINKCR